MSSYKVTVTLQWWRHLNPEELTNKVRFLSDRGMIFDVQREDEPEPKPEVKIIHAPPEVRVLYPCLNKNCDYKATTIGGLKTHWRVHAK